MKRRGVTMTREERILRAKECLKAYNEVYYKDGDFYKADFWDYAEIFEMVLDAYEITKDEEYKAQLTEMHKYVMERYKETWEYNPYNDDIMWLTIAHARLSLLTGEKKYAEIAKKNFDLTYERAYDKELGGGLYWRIEKRGKNACITSPASIAASLLYKLYGDEDYLNKAKDLAEWMTKTLVREDGKVYDNIGIHGRIQEKTWTYNEGTYIGANTLLYILTGEEKYLQAAEKAASYTKNRMYESGIMNDEGEGGDQPGFKGILSRWLRLFALTSGKEEYLEWLRINAESAYENRNSKGIIGTMLATKTTEDDYDVFTCSSAVAIAFNSI